MPCMSCDRDTLDCSTCHGDGFTRLYECPRNMVTTEIFEGVRSALRAKVYSIWPVTGGSQDQSRAFMQLFDVVSDEVNRVEAEEMKKSHGSS